MDDPKRILIVRPSALGDVCRTVGVLVSLRKAYPEARIDWVVQEEFSAAIRSHPALDGTIEFPRVRMGHWWRSPARAREVLHWLRELRQGGYDLVFDLQGLGRSGMMTWVTGASRRVGRRWARELGWLGYNVRHSWPTDRHTVEQMMSLLVAEGIAPIYDLTLYVAQEHRRWWASQPQARGAYAVLAPTSRWPSKRWPAANFSALIGPLLERGFDRVIMIGSPREVDQTRGIAPADGKARAAVVDLVGRTSLGQTMAVIAGAELVIANDSAPLHMAVGFARPCLGLYGPTDPARVGPYGHREAVLRGFSPAPGQSVNYRDRRLGDSLMRLIRPGAVLERVDRILSGHLGPADDDGRAHETSDAVQGAAR